MGRLLVNDERTPKWVASHFGESDAPSVDNSLGWEEDGQIVAGVFFDGFTKNNIFAHIAASDRIPVALLRAVATYVYRQLGLSRMTFMVPSDNMKAIQLVVRMGAGLEATLQDAHGPGRHALLFVLWAGADFPQRMLAR